VTPSVLHVLPHPGAGGETYLDLLEPMEGFSFERVSLTERRGPLEIARGLSRARRAARDADLVHLHGDTVALLCAGLAKRRPGVITFHGLHRLRRSGGPMRRALALGLRRAIGLARASICLSESELADAVPLAGPRLRDRLVMIHNGVGDPGPPGDGLRERTRRALGLEAGDVAVLYLGQLEERKGVLDLVDALGRARGSGAPVVGLFAGDGPLRGEVASRAPEVGAVALGHRDDAGALLEAADVFVMPSAREGLSLAVLEAMARGRAVIVSDGPGNPEAVGDAGIVTPFGDLVELTEALGRLAGDSALRSRLGAAARERAATRFGAERMIAETRRVYERAIS